MDKFDVLMNPVRQRIFQYLMIHEKGTVKEIKKALPDVPNASLYRHVKILEDAGVIEVLQKNQVRGAKESVYVTNKETLSTDDKEGLAVRQVLVKLYTDFSKYFASDNADPIKDMLSVSTGTLTLDDKKFAEYLEEIYNITLRYMAEEVTKNSKVRQITFISAPVEKTQQ